MGEFVGKPIKPTMVKCTKCDGTGKINKETCSTCKGTGKVELLKS